MLRVAICDDDEALCYSLEKMVTKNCASRREEVSVEIFFDGENLCQYMRQGHDFNVIFLDIEMKKKDGVATGHEIREAMQDEDVELIYISCKETYAIQLFESRPMNFIIKPITYEKIDHVLTQIFRQVTKTNTLFEYSINRQINGISLKKIQYFEVRNRQIIIYTKDEKIVFYGKLTEVVEKVKNQKFIRINRSELVNYDAIESYQGDKIILYGKKVLYVGSARHKEVQEQMLLYMREDR